MFADLCPNTDDDDDDDDDDDEQSKYPLRLLRTTIHSAMSTITYNC